MKAERVESIQEFIPVIVTLESQEEVDSLYTIGNHHIISYALPALRGWYRQLAPFTSSSSQHRSKLWDKLNAAIR